MYMYNIVRLSVTFAVQLMQMASFPGRITCPISWPKGITGQVTILFTQAASLRNMTSIHDVGWSLCIQFDHLKLITARQGNSVHVHTLMAFLHFFGTIPTENNINSGINRVQMPIVPVIINSELILIPVKRFAQWLKQIREKGQRQGQLQSHNRNFRNKACKLTSGVHVHLQIC